MESAPHPRTSGSLPRWRLRKSTPEDFGGLGEDAAADPEVGHRMPRRLLCRSCRRPITADEHRIAIGGRHVHRRVNPIGIEFEFGCFGEAPGAAKLGQPTTAYSWFAGYAWSLAHCGLCGVHLGWFFEGVEPAFFGLISNLLEEEKEE